MTKKSHHPKPDNVKSILTRPLPSIGHGVSERLLILLILLAASITAGVLSIGMSRLRPRVMAPQAAVVLAEPGQSLARQGYTVLVDQVQKDLGGDKMFAPGAGKAYLKLTLRVTNTSHEVIGVYPFTSTHILADDQQLYPMSPMMLQNPFQPGEIAPGEELAGELSFEIPATTHNPVLVYETPWGTERVQVKL
jgi:hypothetical protein